MSTWSKVFHGLVVILVFCLTGLTASRVSALLAFWLGIERFSLTWWLVVIPVITAVYPFILLFFAGLCGKYRYFLERQKRLYGRILSIIRH